jgi:hypothetical protein
MRRLASFSVGVARLVLHGCSTTGKLSDHPRPVVPHDLRLGGGRNRCRNGALIKGETAVIEPPHQAREGSGFSDVRLLAESAGRLPAGGSADHVAARRLTGGAPTPSAGGRPPTLPPSSASTPPASPPVYRHPASSMATDRVGSALCEAYVIGCDSGGDCESVVLRPGLWLRPGRVTVARRKPGSPRSETRAPCRLPFPRSDDG